MSAFQAYAGGYEFEGVPYAWRCYATVRVHAIRSLDHGPFPRPPEGLKWTAPVQQQHERQVACLLDEGVVDFSLILLQVQQRAQPALPDGPSSSELVSPLA